VTLIDASEQPFTEAVVEVGLKEDQGSVSMRWFKISAVPPRTSCFAFDSTSNNNRTSAGQLDWFVKERQRWLGRVRGGDGKQR
jgi:hypothetical protein